MNWLDITIIVFMILSLWTGFNRGFLNEILSSLGWICAIIIVYIFTGDAYELTTKYLPLPNMEALGSKNIHILFSIVFFGITLFICQLILRLIAMPFRSITEGRINNFLGLCLGGFKAFVFMSLIWYGLREYNIFDTIELLSNAKHNSLPQNILDGAANILNNIIPLLLSFVIR